MSRRIAVVVSPREYDIAALDWGQFAARDAIAANEGLLHAEGARAAAFFDFSGQSFTFADGPPKN